MRTSDEEKVITKAENVWEDYTSSPVPSRHSELFEQEVGELGPHACLHLRRALQERRRRSGRLKNARIVLPALLRRAKDFKTQSETLA
jgi:hypothetical protein